ncbi:MAG: T9SS C-terminal target domain-containing protein [Ignavibacteriae bacterium]|nr:MAG: T9SS C-terminal target domain-containing protein [Ignavibacteriota bacterium]
MKLFLYFILIFGFNTEIYSQNFFVPTSVLSTGTEYVDAIASTSSGVVLAAQLNSGVYRTTNNGINWAICGLTGRRVYKIASAPDGNIFTLGGTTSNIYISRSTDNGLSWSDVMTQARANNYANGGGGIVFVNSTTIVAALSFTLGPTIGDVAAVIMRSTDAGSSWIQVYTLVTGFTNDLVLTPTGKILAATSLGGVKASTNNGTNWLNTGYNIYSNRLEVNSLGHVFVSRATAGDTIDMIYKSTDDGVLWFPVNCSGRSIRDFIIDSQDRLYVSNESKQVKRSSDGGSTWEYITSGIPASQYVYSLYMAGNGILFAGTNSSGVYRSATVVSSGNINGNIPSAFSLKQNYPNPFNPVTIINYQLAASNYVKLTISDIAGREVAVLVNQKQNAGKYEVKWDASNYSTGVYFYRLISREFSETRKMILLK